MYEDKRLTVFSSNLPFLVSINIGIATVLVASGMYGQGTSTGKIHWLLCLYFISAVRLFIHYGMDSTSKHKLDFHFAGVVIAAIIWACYPYMFHQSMTTKEMMMTLIIFCGMSGGSVTLLSSDRRAALAFVIITVFPYSVVLMTASDSDMQSFGFMGLVYGIALCLSAIRSAQFITTSIDTQNQIEKLVLNLETEVKHRTNEISKLEQRDMLTGLFNRNSFSSKVELIQAKHSNQNSLINGFIHIDIEKFHIINDNYGHEYGDYVLSEIGQELLKIDKFYGSTSARWGNDEFILHISSRSQYALREFIQQVKERLTVYIQLENIRVIPDFHIGYYICDNSVPIEDAIRNAYLAVIQGKNNNIRICYFDEEINEYNQRKEYLRSGIKTALENEKFYMNYQPIVDVESGYIHSFEALVRWNLDGKSISPAEFISIAEEHGLIIELGQMVLKMSIEALATVNQRYSAISISINVSVIQFEDESFLDYLKFLIAKFLVNPKNIHLEITETAMITNLDKLTKIIMYAKKIGVMISVDDFGTGFSSISVLRNLQIDYIKIDKSYIDNICLDEKDHSIVSAVTKMAHTIGSKVIAEGVESTDQLALIAKSDIDFYQGYLFSKPVTFDAMLSMLDNMSVS
jgi:diguanylate cyclase (GGDEF)-like protein